MRGQIQSRRDQIISMGSAALTALAGRQVKFCFYAILLLKQNVT